MEYSHIIQIKGAAARPQFLTNFKHAFGWDLTKQDFGFEKSITFIKEIYGELSTGLKNKIKKSDIVFITSIESLLSAAGIMNSIRDKDFYRNTMAIKSIPFEIKVDFLHSLLLNQCHSGFFCWLGQRHIAIDEACFNNLKTLLEAGGIAVNVRKPLKV